MRIFVVELLVYVDDESVMKIKVLSIANNEFNAVENAIDEVQGQIDPITDTIIVNKWYEIEDDTTIINTETAYSLK